MIQKLQLRLKEINHCRINRLVIRKKDKTSVRKDLKAQSADG